MTSQKQKQNQFSHHLPVLLESTIELLSPGADESYLDLTAGYGGHAKAVIDVTAAPNKAVLVDRDPSAIRELKKLKYADDKAPELRHETYEATARHLGEEGKRFDMILMDLGVSSPQLDNPKRGFSIIRDGPLDMRMDSQAETTAAEIVNEQSEETLADMLKKYGEEPHARTIAKAIIEARPISSTNHLAEVIKQRLGRRGKTHPATRTFQALRIAVNDELGQLERTLPLLLDLLEPKGRLAVISFHSLEDRIVKNFFKEESRSGYEATLDVLTKPILGKTYDVINPRARSAILRAAMRK